MSQFPSDDTSDMPPVAGQDATVAGFTALRDMDPDATCPNNRPSEAFKLAQALLAAIDL